MKKSKKRNKAKIISLKSIQQNTIKSKRRIFEGGKKNNAGHLRC
jgi:hypothetical protein